MKEKVRQIVVDNARLVVDASVLEDDDDLYRAGLTSHGIIKLMLALEMGLDIEFPQSRLKKSTFGSISSITAVVEEILGAPAQRSATSTLSAPEPGSLDALPVIPVRQ